MTRPLRQRHRLAMFSLGLLLPSLFAVALSVRHPFPTTVPLLPIDRSSATISLTELWARGDLWDEHPMETRLLADRSTGILLVELKPKSEIARPDLILYWAPGEAPIGRALPKEAFLLGSFDGQSPLPLPGAASDRTGTLILYSLAENELIEASKHFTTAAYER